MTDPGNDNNIIKRRPTTAAVFLISALIVVILAIKADDPPVALKEETQTTAQVAPPPDTAGTIDENAIRAWQNAATAQNIDVALYNAIYVQDSRSYSVLLTPKDEASGLPIYTVDIERGSNRIMAFGQRQ